MWAVIGGAVGVVAVFLVYVFGFWRGSTRRIGLTRDAMQDAYDMGKKEGREEGSAGLPFLIGIINRHRSEQGLDPIKSDEVKWMS